MIIEDRLSSFLTKRKEENAFRSLQYYEGLVDFCSNDYLGLARSTLLKEALSHHDFYLYGATGSRLISGNFPQTEALELKIATFHQAEAGLLYNSGYDANIGFFSCVPRRGDLILFDDLVHASIRDGIRLSHAKSLSFKHNDKEDLERLLETQTGFSAIFIAVESVYSMDGDLAPLADFVCLAKKFQANIVIDEAHSTGVMGKAGRGLTCEQGLEKDIFARIHTFGKAVGCHGAIIVGSAILKEYLINFSRSFIYTTALPLHTVMALGIAYDLLEKYADEWINMLNQNILYFRKLAADKNIPLLNSPSAIQSVLLPENSNVKAVAAHIRQKGYDVRAILYPTVPKGSERIRICLHSFNTPQEIKGLIECF